MVGLAAIACQPPPAPEPTGDLSSHVAVSIDGRPVDCAWPQTFAVGARATIQVAGAGALEVRVGDRDVTDQLDGDPLAVEVDLAPDAPLVVSVVARSDGAEARCEASIVHRAAVEAALETLASESAGGADVTRSEETGAPANATLRVGTTGDDPSAQAADFLARHAAAFGVDPAQLVEVGIDVAPDGWATVRFDQAVDGLRALEAGLDVELDPNGVVTSVQSRLFVGVDEAPAFRATEAEARDVAALELGEVYAVTAVLFDPRRPRAAWLAEGELEALVIDDATLAVDLRFDTAPDEVPVEIHRPSPDPLPEGSRDNLAGHALIARADHRGGAPAGLAPRDAQVWRWAAEIAGRVETGSGQAGWRALPYPNRTISPLTEGSVRFMVEASNTGSTAGWYSYGIVYLGDGSATQPEVVCHEYGHALHDTLRRNRFEARSVKEAVGDIFWVVCDPWLTGRRRTGYRGQNFASPPGGHQSDYDAFRAAGLTALNAHQTNDVHAHTYLLSSPFYWMGERYGMTPDRVEQLAYFALSYRHTGSADRFRTYRNAILQEADSWARNGRHGFTASDVCAVAQAFREVNLDGEYGVGAEATCGGVGAGDSADVDPYVCTDLYCPLCPMENPNPCDPPPTADEPHCVAPGFAGAGDRRICVGALAITDDGCREGWFHHCFCEADGSWSCPGPCQDLSEGLLYCPESRYGGAAGYRRQDCAIHPVSDAPSGPAWALLGALAALRLRRIRPRRGRPGSGRAPRSRST